jgi:guanylate kinase
VKEDTETPRFPDHVPLVMIVSGPAGAGKTSVVNSLLTVADDFLRAITCTCRSPRKGEIPGVDYHFVSPEEFQRRLRAGDLLEHARVYGFDYGMPRQNITRALEQHKNLVINIDVQGAATIRDRAAELKLSSLGSSLDQDLRLSDILISVFIMPASMAQVEARLRNRSTDDEATIQRRLLIAREEIQRWPEYDYVLVSGPLDEDLRKLQSIVAAERMRTRRLGDLVGKGTSRA